MAKKFDKEALFNNYFSTANDVFSLFEGRFKVKGVWSQIFGVTPEEHHTFASAEDERAAMDHVRSSDAWRLLSDLYDYAVEGIINDADPVDVVVDGAEVLSFITTENRGPSFEWQMITAQGDGRFALDEGEDVLIERVALLAGVDVRTVRNAVSAGELIVYKSNDGPVINNSAARKWLNARRGFKPTLIASDNLIKLKDIASPSAFGAFLTAQRKRIGLDQDDKKLVVFHPSVDTKAISEIEAGVFNLPIDTVFPLADFYQLDRKELLSCVMQVFFSDQFSTLRETLLAEK